jgi:hypothetical protein
VVLDLDPHDALAYVERVVGLLRVRGPEVDHFTCDLREDRAVMVLWGTALHGGNADATVLRRLARMPGVLSVGIGTKG